MLRFERTGKGLTMLKIGITDSSYGVYGNDKYRKIKDSGYDCIDYQNFANIKSDFFNLPEDEFADELASERKHIESLGLTVHQAHAPWIWGEGRDHTPCERENWLKAVKKAIRGTVILGAEKLVLHALMPYDDTDQCCSEVVMLNEEFIASVADYAKEYGVTVCLENLPFPKHPVSSVKEVCDMVDKLGRDNLGVCLDTGHAAIYDTDVAAAVRYIGGRLRALHIHDNMGDADSHLIPGDGVIDWSAFAEALSEVGYSGELSLETSPKHGKFPKEQWNDREEILFEIILDIAKKVI